MNEPQIIQNGFQRKDTGEIRVSCHRHHFIMVEIDGESYGIDGGFDYFRRIGNWEENDFIFDLSLTSDSPVEELAEKLVYTQKGRLGWIFLNSCTKKELKEILVEAEKPCSVPARRDAIKRAATFLLETK